jgi:hypothetical protein
MMGNKTMTNTEYMRARLTAGIHDAHPGKKRESLESLRSSEWSPEFERLMRNRLLVGRFRYASMADPNRPQYNRMESASKRLREYQDIGNLELLVDVANLCLLEFVHGDHPSKHFNAKDDGEHVASVDWSAA